LERAGGFHDCLIGRSRRANGHDAGNRERLVETRLSVCKREQPDLAQELVPGDGIERRAQNQRRVD
jgi:hypothetical protein